MWAKHYQLGVIDSYNETVSSMDDDAIDAQLAKAEAYNKSLLTSKVTLSDPFDTDTATEKEDNATYESMLNMTDAMAYIEIPSINVYLPIYHGTDEETLSKGVGHLEGTSLPIGGVGTHCVLSAHSGLPTAELFTNLEKLEIGDDFYIHVLNEVLTYQVDQIKVVLPSDTSLLQIDPDEDYVTLVTCTPYAVNTHRLLVRGTRIYPTDKSQQTISNQSYVSVQLTHVEIVQYLAFFLATILFLLITVFFIRSRMKDRKSKGKNDDET